MNRLELLAELKRLNPNHKRLRFFEENATAISLQMLGDALAREQRIRGQQMTAITPKKSVLAVIEADAEKVNIGYLDAESMRAKIIKKNPTFNFEDLPEDLQAVYNEIGEQYKERTSLHEKAKLSEDAAVRAQCIAEADNLSKSIAAKYELIDAFIEGKEVPPAVEPTPEPTNEVAQKLKRIANISSNISKLKKKIEEVEASEREAIREEIEELSKEKEILVAWKKLLK